MLRFVTLGSRYIILGNVLGNSISTDCTRPAVASAGELCFCHRSMQSSPALHGHSRSIVLSVDGYIEVPRSVDSFINMQILHNGCNLSVTCLNVFGGDQCYVTTGQ